MSYFDGEINLADMFAELGRGGAGGTSDVFPLRTRVGTTADGVSATGGRIAGVFTALPGHESIPGQRETVQAEASEIETPSGRKVAISHIWTLPGAWPEISEKCQIQELDAEGQPVAVYEIATADVHVHSIHTVLKTKRVKRT